MANTYNLRQFCDILDCLNLRHFFNCWLFYALDCVEMAQVVKNVLVAQTKRMTTNLRLPSRFNAASLATNLKTTTMYPQSQNRIILNLVRSLHDRDVRVNYYGTPTTLAVYHNPFLID